MRLIFILVAFCASVVLLHLAGLSPRGNSPVISERVVDPGAISGVHARFTRDQGCDSCHESHSKSGLSWLKAAFQPADMGTKCVSCHRFDGVAFRPHNKTHSNTRHESDVSCASCHKEHRGTDFDVAKVPDSTCATCHKSIAGNFPEAHVQFRNDYPSSGVGRIYYDHARHAGKHFRDPKILATSTEPRKKQLTGANNCAMCHAATPRSGVMETKSYAITCAGCHDSEIKGSELTVLEPESPTFPASLLIGVAKDGQEEVFQTDLGRLWKAIATKGRTAIFDALMQAEILDRRSIGGIFGGVDEKFFRRFAASWAKGDDIELGSKQGTAGWGVRENIDGRPAMVYVPGGHADPVLKAWIDATANASKMRTGKSAEIATAALEQFLDSDAPGACGKCHGSSIRNAATTQARTAWSLQAGARSSGTFSHETHTALYPPSDSCGSCHRFREDGAYARFFAPKPIRAAGFVSGFASITKVDCAECHQSGAVSSSCQTCHTYHPRQKLHLPGHSEALVKK